MHQIELKKGGERIPEPTDSDISAHEPEYDDLCYIVEPERTTQVERPIPSQEDKVDIESLPDSDQDCFDAEPARTNAGTEDVDHSMHDIDTELPAEQTSPERLVIWTKSLKK